MDCFFRSPYRNLYALILSLKTIHYYNTILNNIFAIIRNFLRTKVRIPETILNKTKQMNCVKEPCDDGILKFKLSFFLNSKFLNETFL